MTTFSLPKTNTLAYDLDTRRRIFSFMLAAIALFSGLYIYFLGHIVFDIIGRRAAISQTHELASSVGALEVQYISLTNKIDLAYAKANGFTESKSPEFASRKGAVAFNTNRNDL